jgi:hypothetical protein
MALEAGGQKERVIHKRRALCGISCGNLRDVRDVNSFFLWEKFFCLENFFYRRNVEALGRLSEYFIGGHNL